jgi:hypothetical protein
MIGHLSRPPAQNVTWSGTLPAVVIAALVDPRIYLWPECNSRLEADFGIAF